MASLKMKDLCRIGMFVVSFLGVTLIGLEPPATLSQGPPATYYGTVSGDDVFTEVAGMAVTAQMDGNECGSALTLEDGSEIVYTINVLSEGPGGKDGCGAENPPHTITFYVDGVPMAPTTVWDNSQPWEVPLVPMTKPQAPSDIELSQSGDDLILTWSAVLVDLNNLATSILQYEIWRSPGPYFDPDQPGCDCTLIASVADTEYRDQDDVGVDIIGDPATNYYYAIRAVNAAGGAEFSKQVAAFDFALIAQ